MLEGRAFARSPAVPTARPRNPGRVATRAVLAAGAAASLFWIPTVVRAHDIPRDVTVQALLVPEGQRLHLLVRVPLIAMRDVDYPTRGVGYLDLPRVGALLENAARLWIADPIELYEDETRLSPPRITAVRVSLPSDKSFGSFDLSLIHI